MTLPKMTYHWRLGAIGYGLILLLWLSIEDSRVWPVTLLGTGTALLSLSLFVVSRCGGRPLSRRWLPVVSVLLGALAGASSIAFTAALMFFKSAWHNHLYPDFPAQLILDLLSRLPAWTLAGLLIGLASSLLLLSTKSPESMPQT